MTTLIVDEEKCLKCRECADMCFMNCIAWNYEENKPFMKYGYDCQVCSECEDLCRAGALTIVPDWSDKHRPRLLSE